MINSQKLTSNISKLFVQDELLSQRFNSPKIGNLCKNVAVVINSFLLISFFSNRRNSFSKSASKFLNLFLSSNTRQLDEALLPKELPILEIDIIVMVLHDDIDE